VSAAELSGGPVGTASEIWSFDVLELEGPAGDAPDRSASPEPAGTGGDA